MGDSAEKNREHFNNAAATYNNKFEKTISAIIKELQARLDWIGVDWVTDSSSSDEEKEKEAPGTPSSKQPKKKIVRLLDYACGTGLVSRALAPHVTQSIGIDISENMVQAYNTTAQNQGLPPTEMRAVVSNLLSPSNPTPPELYGPDFQDFDIAAVGLGFHHFEDPGLAAKRLADRLKKGGVLLILDFLPHKPHDFSHGSHGEAARHTVMHMGFSEEDIRRMFTEAGCGGSFEYEVVGNGVVFVKGEAGTHEEIKRSVFIARGTKL